MKPLIISLFSVLLCIGCGAALSTKDWMQKISGIEIPASAHAVTIYDKHEAYKALYCQLSADDARRISERGPFSIEQPRNFYEIEASHLPKIYRKGPSLRYATGALDYNAWDAVVDVSTGELWLLVESPDFGGDLPSRSLKSKK